MAGLPRINLVFDGMKRTIPCASDSSPQFFVTLLADTGDGSGIIEDYFLLQATALFVDPGIAILGDRFTALLEDFIFCGGTTFSILNIMHTALYGTSDCRLVRDQPECGDAKR